MNLVAKFYIASAHPMLNKNASMCLNSSVSVV